LSGNSLLVQVENGTVSAAPRRDILYLVHRFPYPPDKGDRIRAFHILKHLAGQAAVHVACLADEPVSDAHMAALQRSCHRLAVVPVAKVSRWARALGSLARGGTVTEGVFCSAALRATIERWIQETPFAACLISASSMVQYLDQPALRHVPTVIDLVDVDSQKWHDYADVSGGVRAWLYRTEGNRLRSLEQGLPARARAVTLVSEAEADLYRHFCLPGCVRPVANGVDLQYFRPIYQAESFECVFVGALDYLPNVDGVCWFCHEIWPTVRRSLPEAKVLVVGRRPVPAVRRLARLPGVNLIGPVPDIRPYLARAAVAVVPLRIARGVQNKVLEALAMSKATVVSPAALRGIGARSGEHVVCAHSPEEWAAAILRLLNSEAERGRLGSNGRRFLERHHRWEQCLAPLSCLLGLENEDDPGTDAHTKSANRNDCISDHALPS
jgi:sugar transferase (PEP-CTERM/EpsH1 system associated)